MELLLTKLCLIIKITMCRDSTEFFRKRTYKQPLMTILGERVLSPHLNGVLQLDGAFYVD